jgi:hypothetical protein
MRLVSVKGVNDVSVIAFNRNERAYLVLAILEAPLFDGGERCLELSCQSLCIIVCAGEGEECERLNAHQLLRSMVGVAYEIVTARPGRGQV